MLQKLREEQAQQKREYREFRAIHIQIRWRMFSVRKAAKLRNVTLLEELERCEAAAPHTIGTSSLAEMKPPLSPWCFPLQRSNRPSRSYLRG